MDPRIEALEGIIMNLQECPADQSDDFLARASNLAQRLRGLAETERLYRATAVDSPA